MADREQYTKQQAIEILGVARAKMDAITTKDEAIALILATGNEVGYTPAFRCLVAGKKPEESVRWK